MQDIGLNLPNIKTLKLHTHDMTTAGFWVLLRTCTSLKECYIAQSQTPAVVQAADLVHILAPCAATLEVLHLDVSVGWGLDSIDTWSFEETLSDDMQQFSALRVLHINHRAL